MDPEAGDIKVELGSLLRDEKDVRRPVSYAMGVSQLVVNVRSFVCQVENQEFGTLDQIDDFHDDEARCDVLVYSLGFEAQSLARPLDRIEGVLHTVPEKRHANEDQIGFVIRFVILPLPG